MRRGAPAGFTLIEVVVTILILVIGIVALIGSSQVASGSARLATLELRVTELVQGETERLKTIELDSIADAQATRPAGDVAWTVLDSTSYVRVEVVVTARPLAGATLTDTVYVYRAR